MDKVTIVDCSALEFIKNSKDGLDIYTMCHSKGFKETYREYVLDGVGLDWNNVNDSKFAQFQYCHFVGSIYITDISRWMSAFTSAAITDPDVGSLMTIFNLTISNTRRSLIKCLNINHHLGMLEPHSDDPKQSLVVYIHLIKDVISELYHIADGLLPILNILLARKKSLDGCGELLASMDEFYQAYVGLVNEGTATE